MLHLISKEKSSTERLYKTLSFIEPHLEVGLIPVIINNRARYLRDHSKMTKLLLSGVYCLYDGETLLSVATIYLNKIDRIITIPRFRHQGHSSRLLRHIAEQMKQCGIAVICPVEEYIEPLFYKLGWKRTDVSAHDGTHDFYLPEHEQIYNEMVEYGYSPDFAPLIRHLLSISVAP